METVKYRKNREFSRIDMEVEDMEVKDMEIDLEMDIKTTPAPILVPQPQP